MLKRTFKDKLFPGVLRERWPLILICDRDPKYLGLFEELMKQTDVRKAAVGHPETDGLSERMVKTSKKIIKAPKAQRREEVKVLKLSSDRQLWLPVLVP